MVEAPKTQPNAEKAPIIKPPSYLTRWFLQYYRLATAVVCLLLLVLGYFLLISPKLSRARTVEAVKLTEETERQQNLELKLQYLVSLSKKRAAMSATDIKKVEAMLPIDLAVPELFTILEGIAKESQVTVEGIDIALMEQAKAKNKDSKTKEAPAVVNLPPGVRGLEISLTVVGAPYNSLKKFLGNIEKSLRLLDIVSLMYSPTAKSYAVTMRTYYISKE